ncbi:MAG: signal recognition particle receptor subunit alpha, partial [Ectothiorhodospiraceae bacterium]|nr:signal recognition particle receptor subunit alpha [Ectothiorhodospiraceae bacterium]
MFGFRKKKPPESSPPPETPEVAEAPAAEAPETAAPAPPPTQTPPPAPQKEGLFSRLRKGLSKTGQALTEGVASLVLGKKAIDDELLEELETRLLMADVGVEATRQILDDLTRRVARKELDDADALMQALRQAMTGVLAPCSVPLVVDATRRPYVILVVGINGAGKTTTIGKLAKRLQQEGRSVM